MINLWDGFVSYKNESCNRSTELRSKLSGAWEKVKQEKTLTSCKSTEAAVVSFSKSAKSLEKESVLLKRQRAGTIY